MRNTTPGVRIPLLALFEKDIMKTINLHKVAKKYKVKLTLDYTQNGRKNGGLSVGNRIYIYPCDKEWMEELSLWHEIGHVVLSRLISKSKRTHYMGTVTQEGAAWELGLIEASKYSRVWGFFSEELIWARKQLATYVNGEYDEMKEYYKFNRDTA